MNLNPAPFKKEDKANVTLHVDIESILSISEVSEIFRVQFQLYMVWKDQRLTFRNLKKDNFLNAVSQNESDNIWTPVVVFKNTQNMERSKVTCIKCHVYCRQIMTQDFNFIFKA